METNKVCYKCNQSVFTLESEESSCNSLYICINCIPKSKPYNYMKQGVSNEFSTSDNR